METPLGEKKTLTESSVEGSNQVEARVGKINPVPLKFMKDSWKEKVVTLSGGRQIAKGKTTKNEKNELKRSFFSTNTCRYLR